MNFEIKIGIDLMFVLLFLSLFPFLALSSQIPRRRRRRIIRATTIALRELQQQEIRCRDYEAYPNIEMSIDVSIK